MLSNRVNATLLSRLPTLSLEDCHLTAGCLFQSVWNRHSGRKADEGIRDYDIFYFDDRDLSWGAEDDVIRRVDALTRDLGVKVEVRNQTRVHRWFERRFGASCPPLASAREGIDRFLVACTCVGIEVASGVLYAPNGLEDLSRGVLRSNPANARPALFRQKAEDYQTRWPWLTIADELG